jgi:2-amino-4-hydroxy-6-hydroxymethyldihydropteridine diphosphokinase
VVALGSNLGDRLANLRLALAHLPGLSAVSPVYESDPVGGPAGQPAYLNAVVVLEGVTPRAALEAGRRAEEAAGRVRAERWGPRTLDVDVIAADDEVDEPDLTVPHPRAAERAFVLVPWADVEPDAALGGVRVGELASRSDHGGLRRTELVLEVPA